MQEARRLSDLDFNPLVGFDFFYVKSRDREQVSGEWLRALDPCRVKYREKVIHQSLPSHICGIPSYEMPLTSSVIMHINHWVHLLWANQQSIVIRWADTITGRPFWTAFKLLQAFILFLGWAMINLWRYQSLSLAFGGNAFRHAVLRSFNIIGKGCDIHPTAILELSQLGDGVTVGPQSRVSYTLIGNDVTIEDKCKILFSAIDHRCYVSQISILNGCAGGPDSDLCIDGAQFCLMGRECALTGLVRPIDTSLGRTIKVMHQGQAVDTEREFLGSAFGHRCFLGPDIYISHGREIPNDAIIVQEPGRVLFKPPQRVRKGEIYVVREGSLQPLDKNDKRKEEEGKS
jgi:carbonic anhydrase/acetyltransferase-like protein (isoleucine patch superfamily)